MNTVQIAAEKFQAEKTKFCEKLEKYKSANGEADRLANLLQATEAEATACADERKAFIESGGDVFDPRSKKLRKQGQEHLELIDDLKLAIETHRKNADEMLFDLSQLHRNAVGQRHIYTNELIASGIAKVLENPPVDLLRACHLATEAAFDEPFNFDALVLYKSGDSFTYEAMFMMQLEKIFHGFLRGFADRNANQDLISADEKALLSIPVFKEKLSPARAHFIKGLRAGKFDNAAYPYKDQKAIGGDDVEARSRSLASI